MGVMNAQRGIIPARAGSTTLFSLLSRRHRDHPRSRGVYEYDHSSMTREKGSSPLARGLLIYRPFQEGGRGIIPARAGSTPFDVGEPAQAGDHPRSRGVYVVLIPGRHRQCLDHPRSRGVYASSHWDRSARKGSSPLARGLHNERISKLLENGIIPARAGSTKAPPQNSAWTGDHPRSRGVYDDGSWRSRVSVGSSPLARGLQCVRRADDAVVRIIPARAGSTQESCA